MSQTAEPEQDVQLDPRLAAVLACTEEQELEVLHEILCSGIDQGWFLRPSPDELLWPEPRQVEQFFDLLSGRPDVRLTEGDPWALTSPSVEPMPGGEPGWVVLTQRCDLVRPFRAEPVVEVARARLVEGTDATAAKTNSPRLVAFREDDEGAIWAADLRQRAWIPKLRLPSQLDLTQAITTDRSRKHFRLRLGQRYWRDPVPDDLVAALQRPLRDAVKGSASRISKLRNFVMWLGFRTEDGRVLVVAVAEESRLVEAEEDWSELMRLLETRAPEAHALIEQDDSGVYAAADVSLDMWLESFKFDFDELTYSRRADDDHAEPAR